MAVGRNVEVLPAQDFNKCLPSILPVIPSDCHIFTFFDPDGLELNWQTVAAVGSRRHRELLINFSNGVFRCAQTARNNKKHHDRMNSFMGLESDWWRYASEDILETYKTNLRSLGGGFKHVLDLPVRNVNKSVVYNLLFATDNDTAVKILAERMRHLEGLTTDHLRVLFLREQGENVPDLTQFLESPRSPLLKPSQDPGQPQLTRFLEKRP